MTFKSSRRGISRIARPAKTDPERSEISWIAASLDYPGCRFVTIGMDRVEFRRPVREGAILRFAVERASAGRTSVQYTVNVFSDDIASGREESVFSTHVTFVRLDEEGHKTRLPG